MGSSLWSKDMKTRAIYLLLAGIYFGASVVLPNVACAQSDKAQPLGGLDASAIGKVVTASGTVSVEHAAAIVVQANLPTSGTDQVKTGDLVFRGDLVRTGANGALSIAFVDGTSFNVSSNAQMELNEFVYDPKGHSNSTLFSLAKGTFTFIAGDIAHTGDMKVDTPVGTVGIRGTAPRIEIQDDGTVKFSTLIEQK